MKTHLSIILASGLFVILILVTPSTPLPLLQQPNNAISKLTTSTTSPIAAIPKFIDRTLEAGITFSHLQGDQQLTGLNEVMGAGVCAFDYDNDGWIDLFLVNGTGQTRYYGAQHWWHQPKGHALYRNLGNGHFIEVTDKAGLSDQTWGMGCVSGDLDNDGDSDLLLTNLGSNLLYQNNGDGSFTNITDQSGIAGEHWSTSATIMDYNGDGLLDIYITNYIAFQKGAHTYELGSQFAGAAPPAFNSSLYDSQANRLYRNLGDLEFEDAARTAGVENAGGRGLGALWFDANMDNRPDLFVVNDKGASPNTLYINQGDGRFSEPDIAMRVNTALGHMGISAGDIDNDGDLDLVVGSDNKHSHLLLVNGHTTAPAKAHIESQVGQFNDLARPLGIGDEQSIGYAGWSPGLFDFNNDGWLDLFMVNGLTVPDPDSHKVSLGQAKQLWINQGKGMFREVSKQAGSAIQDNQSARGAAFADFDNDGDIDIYVAHNNDLGQLLINDSPPSHWLGIKLEGRIDNHDAIGAKIWLYTNMGTQFRTVTSGNGFISDSDKRLHFGLGDSETIHSIEVQWPNGIKNTYKNIVADQYIKIIQNNPEAISETAFTHPADTDNSKQQPPLKIKLKSNRIHYLSWLAGIEGIDAVLPELGLALADNDPNTRISAINLLGNHKHPKGLVFLTQALSDEAAEVRTKAVQALQNYEDEISIRWLLRAFNDPSAEVRIAVADCFAFFFREEEAVVHRKYLGVPYLVRMLDDLDPKVRIAAVRSLADSEHYRALDPLINLLQDTNEDVRTEAARALGLIRERKAIPALLGLLSNPSQPPNTHAHTLIALKRLNYEAIEQSLDSLLSNDFSDNGLEYTAHSLNIIKAIFKNSVDGVVLKQDKLILLIRRWLTNNITALGSSRDEKTEQIILRIINTLRASQSPLAITPIKYFIDDGSPTVRLTAYQALLKLDLQNRTVHAVSALSDPSLEVRAMILNKLVKRDVSRLHSSLLLDNISHPVTKLSAIKLLGYYSDNNSVKQLYALATSQHESIEAKVAALISLTQTSVEKAPLPEYLFLHEDKRLQQAALLYWANRQHTPKRDLPLKIKDALISRHGNIRKTAIQILLSRKEGWAKRTIRQILLNHNAETALRRNIIEGLSGSKSKYAYHILLELAKTRHGPLSSAALEKLIDLNTSVADEFLWKLLKNSHEDDDIRFIAAKALHPRYGKSAITALHDN